MKGIILAGGKGTRLFPITKVISKQLLPIYDKPMIYYPLSVLMLAKIRDILIITTEKDLFTYKDLLGDGSHIGLHINYEVQNEPNGLAEAFIIGEKFIGSDSVCLILGDNLIYGQDLTSLLENAMNRLNGAMIFGYPMNNPKDFGVAELNQNGEVISIEEKPKNPKSNYAIPGIYFYDNKVIDIAKKIKPSSRNELEISSINNYYLDNHKIDITLFGRGIAWLDTGSPLGLLNASEFVETIQARQGFYISCIEEIAWRKGFINKKQLYNLGEEIKQTDYGKYIISLCNDKK